ncbi:uncharacterized protein LOC118736131 [Rhagoletis pomonella]|uniref:uncharacterized protein LOC118736131 n=1 Tax=Rhagoletis pomonella TaxID=28610 RepID=UPI00177DFDB4|nr:uncharacterized protein LOC118736131 [Rhagoletis pomonella]
MVNVGEDRYEDAITSFHNARLSIKPPPFWKPDPRLWFAQVEAQFVRAGITADETKYYTIVAEIDSAVLTHATDIISSPPVSGKYDALKQRLITEFGESNEKRLKRLFEGCELGEKKPTTLLRDMKDLASQRVNKDVLKSLWLRRLPVQVQQILSTLEGDIEALAKKADNIMEISTTNGNIEVVGVPSEDSSPAIADLISRLDRLERGSNNGKVREERNRSNAVSGTTSSTSSRRTTTQPAHDTCWYHRTFGENATRCRQPCAFGQKRSEN